MKLSEAIRLGSMAAPKAKHTRLNSYLFDEESPKDARCALGAAEFAAGIDSFSDLAENHWTFLRNVARHPLTGTPEPINFIIADLNNGEFCAEWSRERIADWVATIEPKEDVIAPASMEEGVLVGR